MKKKRFSVEQIVGILKPAEVGVPVGELVRKVGISEQTFYRWKKQYARLEIDPLRQLKRLERIKPSAPNQVWSLGFVADQRADGRRFRALTVVDVYTRESLAIESGESLTGEDVVRVLQRVQKNRGGTKRLFCDNGSEFSSPVLDLWAYQNGVKIDFSRPGKPTDNGHIESFNGTFRDECLNAYWFPTLGEARQIIEAWRREYNESRPHRALGERTPHEFAFQIAASCDLKGLENPQDSL